MTVLVTGGMGYIGSHTCVELLKQGMDVVIVDNLVNSSAEAGRRVEQITGRGVTFYEIDVRDRERLDEVFRRHDIDCAIHFAGLKAVGESVTMPIEYYDNNLNSTLVLVQTMRAHNVKKIIFSSSATVYSGDNPMPLYETSRTGNCTNPYGWTKYVCEQILRDAVIADPSWSVVLLRYFNPVGAHASGLIGEDPRGIPNNLMPFISQTAIGRREKLSIFGNDYDTPDGTCIRWTSRAGTSPPSPTWTGTAARACSTSAPVRARACCRWCARLRRRTTSSSRSSTPPAARETCRSSTPARTRARSCCTGAPSSTSRTCAATPGTGR